MFRVSSLSEAVRCTFEQTATSVYSLVVISVIIAEFLFASAVVQCIIFLVLWK